MEKTARINFLKEIYDDYKNKYYDKKSKKCVEVLREWKNNYREKITSGVLTIDEYTNRVGAVSDFLTHFLNITASVFGRSREGNTNQLMLQLNDDGSTYYLGKNSAISNENKTATRTVAEDYFKSYILPLLQEAVSASDSISNIINFEKTNVKYKDFVCKQMIQKIFVLESLSNSTLDYQSCLLHLFKNDVLNDLYGDFFDITLADDTRAGKSYRILKQCYEDLGIADTDRDIKQSFEISKMLWDISNAKYLVSKEQPNAILYGAPGTGKTFEVYNSIKLLTKGNTNKFILVQCHPGFGYEEFIEGLKPVGITANGSIKFEVVSGLFKELCIRAKNDLEHEYYFVADEINRANLSSMFGETLSLIEPSYRDDPTNKANRYLIKTPLSKLIKQYIDSNKLSVDEINKLAYEIIDDEVYFGVPHNIRFIGMMNDVDKSIDTFDLALRRRFMWLRKDFDRDVLVEELSDLYDCSELDNYIKGCESLNNFITSSEKGGLGFGKCYEFGHSYFLKIKLFTRKNSNKISDDSVKKLFDIHLKPVLTEYIRSFKEENEIDAIIKNARNKFLGK